jgi:diguanylate cyclase (GGDEF)-like protein
MKEDLIKKLTKENAALKKQLKNLKLQVSLDGLTGLKNRFAIIPDLTRILKDNVASRKKHRANTVGVLMLDIDWFKEINDHFGHLTGDQVLRRAAQIMKASVKAAARRAEDDVYRFGGEEFLVILPFTDAKGSGVVAERIRQNIASQLIYDFPQIKKDRNMITVSIGGSVQQPKKLLAIKGHRKLLEQTVNKADIYLYQAKQRGRNRSVIAGKEVTPKYARNEGVLPQPRYQG